MPNRYTGISCRSHEACRLDRDAGDVALLDRDLPNESPTACRAVQRASSSFWRPGSSSPSPIRRSRDGGMPGSARGLVVSAQRRLQAVDAGRPGPDTCRSNGPSAVSGVSGYASLSAPLGIQRTLSAGLPIAASLIRPPSWEARTTTGRRPRGRSAVPAAGAGAPSKAAVAFDRGPCR